MGGAFVRLAGTPRVLPLTVGGANRYLVSAIPRRLATAGISVDRVAPPRVLPPTLGGAGLCPVRTHPRCLATLVMIVCLATPPGPRTVVGGATVFLLMTLLMTVRPTGFLVGTEPGLLLDALEDTPALLCLLFLLLASVVNAHLDVSVDAAG